jgi:hypothetical protein
MPWIIDENGSWVQVEDEQFKQQQMAEPDINPYGTDVENQGIRDQQAQLQAEQKAIANDAGLQRLLGKGDRPVLSGNIGDIAADAALISGNALTGLATDVGDLVSYVGDIGRAGVDLLDGGGFNEDNYLFNDSDNPWTAWRIATFEDNYRTQAAKSVGDFVRLGSSLIAGGGVAKFGAKAAIGVAKRIPVAGKLGSGIAANVGLTDLIAKSKSKWNAIGGQSDKLDDVLNAMNGKKGTAKNKVIEALRQDDWMRQPYKEVAERARAAGSVGKGISADIDRYVNGVVDSVKAIPNYGRLLKKGNRGVAIKTFSEAVAWDLFATFNVMGEGNAELDETFGDMIVNTFGDNPMGAGWLLDNVTTTAEDSAFTRKTKGLLDGLIMGSVFNVAFDMARVFRFSKNFSKASVPEQVELLEVFGKEANGMGYTLSDFAGPAVKPGQQWNTDELVDMVADARVVNNETDALRFDSPVQARLAEMEGQASPVRPPDDAAYDARLAEMDQRQAVDDLAAQRELDYQNRQPFGAPRRNADYRLSELTPDVQRALGNMEIARSPEPVVNTPTIGNSLRRDLRDRVDEMLGVVPDDMYSTIMQKVTRLLPANRVDAFDYLQQARRQFNDSQVLPLEEGLVSDAIYADGLEKGYMRVTPEGDILASRSRAVDIDEGDLIAKEGQAIDDQIAYERYLAQNTADNSQLYDDVDAATPQNPADAIEQGPGPASEYLDPQQRQIQTALEESDIGLNPEVQAAVDPARVRVQTDVDNAARVREQYQAGEMARLERYRAVSGIARKFLESEQVPTPQVVKGERGWDIIDETGEVIANARTKTLAEKKVNEAVAARRRAMQRQLDAQLADDTFIPIDASRAPAFSSNITGKVSLSDAQLRAVSEIDPKLADDIATDAAAGGKVKRTYELSQYDMKRISDEITAALDNAELPPSKKRTLTSLRDKLDTQVKSLSPEASLDNYARKAVRDILDLITEGKICNPMDT